MGKLHIAGIIENSVVDGPGYRVTIFTQGCPHHCEGCHNPETWSFDNSCGTWVDTTDVADIIIKNKYCRGLTFSGGEPLLHAKILLELLDILDSMGEMRHIMLYTGYTFEHIMNVFSGNTGDMVLHGIIDSVIALLSRVDILVDGPFIQSQKSLELLYRGSINQRLLDCKKSLMLKIPCDAQIDN